MPACPAAVEEVQARTKQASKCDYSIPIVQHTSNDAVKPLTHEPILDGLVQSAAFFCHPFAI
jgi:hypothetical protein